jgi:[acyl-carrier-protein] S-malonyltransferase
MVDAAAGLGPAIDSAEIRPATIPVIANVTARPIREPDEIRAELVQQVTAPVRWIATIEHMVAAGVDTFVEIGAGTVLSGLLKRIAPDAARSSIGDAGAVQTFTGQQTA